jgi:hypothetical protein
MKDIDKALTVDVRNGLPDELLELLRKFPRGQWANDARLHGLAEGWLQRHNLFRELSVLTGGTESLWVTSRNTCNEQMPSTPPLKADLVGTCQIYCDGPCGPRTETRRLPLDLVTYRRRRRQPSLHGYSGRDRCRRAAILRSEPKALSVRNPNLERS